MELQISVIQLQISAIIQRDMELFRDIYNRFADISKYFTYFIFIVFYRYLQIVYNINYLQIHVSADNLLKVQTACQITTHK